jgi:hypothetical protein
MVARYLVVVMEGSLSAATVWQSKHFCAARV